MMPFLSFVQKEFLHVFRDRKTMLLLFGVPVVQIILFGFALSNEIKNNKIIICDYAMDTASHKLIERFEQSEYFDIEKVLLSHQQIENTFREGKTKMAIVIPHGIYEDLHHLHHAQIQLILDASDPNTATALNNYATSIILDYQKEFLSAEASVPRIETQLRMIYNPELKAATNFVPGVMALVFLLVCVLMTSVSIVREKENGTMEILLVSPLNPIMVVFSKAIPYLVLSLINFAVILLLSIFMLDMSVNGSFLLLFVTSAIYIITALGIGMLISSITASQQTAMLISLLGMLLPALLFTGFMFPLENMPWFLQLISNIVPSKWYFIISKSIMIKGLGIAAIWKETIILVIMAGVFLIGSIKRFKTRLA